MKFNAVNDSSYNLPNTIIKWKDGSDWKIASYDIIGVFNYDSIAENNIKHNAYEISIGNTITAIGAGALSSNLNPPIAGYYNLSSVVFANSVSRIGVSAFIYDKKLQNIEFGSGLTLINANAFQQCTNLTSINFPNTDFKFGTHCFAHCTSLISVTIPESVNLNTPQNYPFSGCGSQLSITFINRTADDMPMQNMYHWAWGYTSYGTIMYQKINPDDPSHPDDPVIDDDTTQQFSFSGIITYQDVIDYFTAKICEICENVDATSQTIPSDFATKDVYSKTGTYTVYYNEFNPWFHVFDDKYHTYSYVFKVKQNGLNAYDIHFYHREDIEQKIINMLYSNNIDVEKVKNHIITSDEFYYIVSIMSLFINQSIFIYVSSYYNKKYTIFKDVTDYSYNVVSGSISSETFLSNYLSCVINENIANYASISALTYTVTNNGGGQQYNP